MHTGKRIVSRALMLISVLALIAGCAPPSFAPGQASLGPSNASVAQQEQPSVAGAPPVDSGQASARTTDIEVSAKLRPATKPIDQPNPLDKARMMERQRMLEAGQTAEAASLAQTGTDRVLVILTEFAGTDVFTWTAPITPSNPATGSQWDPKGIADPNEYTGTVGDCSKIITQTKTFTYTGPLHNQIARPLSFADRSGQSIWTPDFSKQWFNGFLFGNGVTFNYTRTDNSLVNLDFTGKSVAQYFSDLSNGTYTVTGDIIGWLPVPHSTWWYGADKCPGNRSGLSSGTGADGGIPSAGGPATLVKDALNAVNAISNTIPGFSWANYDLNGDGKIDRLWIVHAGYGEEDGADLLNRNPTDPNDPNRMTPDPKSFYGEAAIWSHSSSITPYSVTQNIAAGPYIMMPENGGIGVFAHEYAHNLGADDLYAYGEGETSAGFWALQADDWTGYPIGFEPPAPDPWHLDNWGWLVPKVITDTTQVYTVTIGQASYFNTNTASGPVSRGAKIMLPAGAVPQPAPVWQGSYYWWGGKQDLANGMMTSKPITLPVGTNTLTFDTAYGIETEWDFMWVQVSTNGGTTWNTLTNTNTVCTHASGWIGDQNGMGGKCGFTDYNASFPAPDTETFNLSAYAGQTILLRFWYMTDWGTTYEGPFVDNVKIMAGATTVFADDAESGDAKWVYADPWVRSNGIVYFTHNYYLQWRNTNANGGYDGALGDSRWRFGPANTGLLVWYNNNSKTDNEIFNYLNEFPGYGPKGRMLVVDSHPDPYREPDLVTMGYNNEAGNVASRSQMRDAPFTLQPTVGFTYTSAYPFPITTTLFTNYFNGRPAVSTFNDALGYYPGAENVPGGPVGQTTPRWMTKQWDASATVPSTEFYGIKAPGYVDGTRMRFGCSLNALGQVLCYSYATGLGYNGGTGNPGEVNGQYGWHVQVIDEGADHTWATVKIWNAAVMQTPTYTPHAITSSGAKTITYNYRLENASSVTSTVAVTFTLDSHLTSSSQLTYPALALSAGQVTTLTVVATGTVPSTMTSATWTTKVELNDGINPTVWTNLMPTTIKFYNIYLPTIRR
jgi:immune inhibitor A